MFYIWIQLFSLFVVPIDASIRPEVHSPIPKALTYAKKNG